MDPWPARIDHPGAAISHAIVRDLIATFAVTHIRNVDGDDTDDPRKIASLGFEAHGLSFVCFPSETPVEITFFCTIEDEMINTGINQLHSAFLRHHAIGPIVLFVGVGRDRPVQSDGLCVVAPKIPDGIRLG